MDEGRTIILHETLASADPKIVIFIQGDGCYRWKIQAVGSVKCLICLCDYIPTNKTARGPCPYNAVIVGGDAGHFIPRGKFRPLSWKVRVQDLERSECRQLIIPLEHSFSYRVNLSHCGDEVLPQKAR